MAKLTSRWWHLLSVVIFLGCAVGAPVFMVFSMIGHFSSGEEFFVPGTHALSLKEPGEYVIWNVVSEFRDGRQYEFSNNLPNGTHIKVINGSTGKEIPTEGTMNSSESSGTTERSSICSFKVQTPGAYSVVVDGTSDQRLLMIRHAITANLLWLILVGGIVSVLGWIIPLVISVMVEVCHSRMKKALVNQPPSLPMR